MGISMVEKVAGKVINVLPQLPLFKVWPIEQRFSVVSMFSGCGGMDLGFKGGFSIFGKDYAALPFDIAWANELNPAACRTYRKNVDEKIICGSVWDVMDSIPTNIDVLIGGFPCQDISINGKGAGANGKRSGLYRAMIEAIKLAKPKVFVAENVKGLLMRHNAASLQQVLTDFNSLGYDVTYGLYHAADYGVPQSRERIFIVGTQHGQDKFIPPTPERRKEDWMTAREAIGDLASVEADPHFNHIWSLGRVLSCGRLSWRSARGVMWGCG